MIQYFKFNIIITSLQSFNVESFCKHAGQAPESHLKFPKRGWKWDFTAGILWQLTLNLWTYPRVRLNKAFSWSGSLESPASTAWTVYRAEKGEPNGLVTGHAFKWDAFWRDLAMLRNHTPGLSQTRTTKQWAKEVAFVTFVCFCLQAWWVESEAPTSTALQSLPGKLKPPGFKLLSTFTL